MEQRRVVLFLALSFAVLVLNSVFLAPTPRKQQQVEQPAAESPTEDQQEESEQPPAEGEISESSAESPNETEATPAEPPVELQAPQVPQTFLTLGSMDPDSPYRSLYTFTNQGAGIRRVELASDRYHDLQDRGGYLGHLELAVDPEGGLRAQVVGAGTPAAKAGIEAGDRLVAVKIEGKRTPLETPKQLSTLLASRRPHSRLVLEVVRGDNPPFEAESLLDRRPLEVIRPESENVLMREKKLPEDFVEPPSFRFTLTEIGTQKSADEREEMPGIELLNSNWEVVEHDNTSVVFRQALPGHHLEILKSFRLEPVPEDQHNNPDYPGYSLTLKIEVKNVADEAVEVVYRLDGPNGLPIEGWWYARKFGRHWGAAGLRDVVGRYFGSKTAEISPTTIAKGDAEDFEGRSMAFVGIDAQYFSAMLLPQKMSPDAIWLDVVHPVLLGPKPRARSNDAMYANTSCQLISKELSIKPHDSLKHVYTMFAGPKRPDLLAHYQAVDSPQYTLADLLYYGWFAPVAKLMLGILHAFYAVVRNYGIAIIMLTVLVRSCMVPVSRKQMQSMAKMQLLKPELEKIKQKYKNDTQKQSQAMQELYRKHKINPLAGCLPMFIQLPIFVGLYRSLAVDVELRQAPLISDSIHWCSNLAAPDMFLNWSSFMPDFVNSGQGFLGLGPYLNILPLLTVSLFIAQQKFTMPEPADDQAALQQKMMKYMMIFFGLMFYKVASGLCIYFIASSLWGLMERKLWPPPTLATATGPTETGSTRPLPRSTKNGEAGGKSKRAKKKK